MRSRLPREVTRATSRGRPPGGQVCRCRSMIAGDAPRRRHRRRYGRASARARDRRQGDCAARGRAWRGTRPWRGRASLPPRGAPRAARRSALRSVMSSDTLRTAGAPPEGDGLGVHEQVTWVYRPGAECHLDVAGPAVGVEPRHAQLGPGVRHPLVAGVAAVAERGLVHVEGPSIHDRRWSSAADWRRRPGRSAARSPAAPPRRGRGR